MKRSILGTSTVVLLLATTCGYSEIMVENQPVSFSKEGVDGLSRSVRRTWALNIMNNMDKDTSEGDKIIKCAELKELSRAYLCVSMLQNVLNDTLTRLGFFMGAGAGHPVGTMMKQNDHQLINTKKLVTGHNLPGQTIVDFYSSVKPLEDSDLKLNSMEKEFGDVILKNTKIMENNGQFYVIGFSVQTAKSADKILSHEVYHAQYLLTPKYKETVNQFWKDQVSEEDKKGIQEALGKVYNTEDHIIIDEFQAYIIQDNAEKDLLSSYVGKYRTLLLDALSSNGITPLRFK